MFNKINSGIIFLLAIFFYSCAKDNVFLLNKPLFYTIVNNKLTKTPIENYDNIPIGDSIGLFAVKLSGSELSTLVWPQSIDDYEFYNIAGIAIDGVPQKISLSSPYYFLKNDNIAFFSYYPRSLNVKFNKGYSPSLEIDLSSRPDLQKDILWAPPVIGSSINYYIDLTYSHILSQLGFKISRTCDDVLILKSISISTIQSQRAFFNISNGEFMEKNISNGNTFFYSNNLEFSLPRYSEAIELNPISSTKFLFIPGTVISSIRLLINIEGEKFDREYIIESPSITLNQGYSINANIKVSKNSAILSDWTEINDTTSLGEIMPSNCYILPPNNSININVGVKGNGDYSSANSNLLNVHHITKSIGILWQTSDGLISLEDFDAEKQTVTIKTPLDGITGNALIAAYDDLEKKGDILWSWHIWVTNYNPDNDLGYFINSSFHMMNRNLGAIENTPGSSNAKGLLYQWGRKDPFPSSLNVNNSAEPTLYGLKSQIEKNPVSSLNNLINSIHNPSTFYYSNSGLFDWYTCSDNANNQNNALWGSPKYTAPSVYKTIFDPCPAGWRVPYFYNSSSPWRVYSYSYLRDYGFYWINPDAGFFPASGFRRGENGNLENTGLISAYWSSSSSSDNTNISNKSMSMYFDSNIYYDTFQSNRSYGFSIRCIRGY